MFLLEIIQSWLRIVRLALASSPVQSTLFLLGFTTNLGVKAQLGVSTADWVPFEVALVELFAGMKEVTFAFRRSGLGAAAIELKDHSKLCDLQSPAGMASRP